MIAQESNLTSFFIATNLLACNE